MPAAVSERRRGHVKVKVELGVPTKEIQAQTNVSLRSVQRFRKNILESQGRPRKITPEMERVCPFYAYFLMLKN
jgi:hypothetical protein